MTAPRRIVFRVDSASWIGSGHVTRCATLATALRQTGADIHFICRSLPGNYISWLERSSFVVHRLPAKDGPLELPPLGAPAHASWIGALPAQEVAECGAILAKLSPIEWLIVDHYGLDRQWESAMACWTKKILAIDDLADRPHAANLLLDVNLQPSAGRYLPLLPPGSRVLTGPKFALLSPGFFELRKLGVQRNGQLRNLLIFFGGSDPDDMTRQFLAKLDLKRLPADLRIDVIIGDGNPHYETIAGHCAGHANMALHVQTTRMAELMASADLMIGTPGTTSWERCCLGLPTLTLSVAANQDSNGHLLACDRASLHLGRASTATLEQAADLLQRLPHHPRLLARMSTRASRLTDGRGTQRVIAAMNMEHLNLRPAAEDDVLLLWNWRNDPRTRKTAFDTSKIPLRQHQQWFHKVLANGSQHLLVGMVANCPIGVLRYDQQGDDWEVSVYLDPDLHGLGLGSRLIAAGSLWLAAHTRPFARIVARIRQDNAVSANAFRNAGFSSAGDAFEWLAPAGPQALQETS